VQRRAFLRTGAAAAVAGTAVPAPAIAQGAPEVRWRMTSSFPKSLETIFGSAQTIGRFIAEATDNKFQIQVHAAGELAPSHQALDAVAGGAVECAHTPLYHYIGKGATLGVGSGLPFGLDARDQLSWWTFGGGDEIVNAALRQFNVYGMPAGTTGTQMGAWFKREITSLDDLKGLKIRVGSLGGPILSKIGAVPYRIAHADVYAALANGNIDAAEFICPADDERLGLVRVARFNHYPCWWEPAGMVHFLVNLERWNVLPRRYQVIAARACEAAGAFMLSKYDAVNPPALRRLVAAGAVLKPFPPQVLEACFRAAAEHHGELAAKDAAFKRAYDSASAFRREALPWRQIGQHAYDSLILSMRGRV
jgi:TRAP-type mannitol/chloroaromatic compound transport system substrate-binding protein